MNQQEQFGWNPNPNMAWNPNWNQNQTIRNLENRVTRLEREVQRLNNRVSRIEQISRQDLYWTDLYIPRIK